jgi:predicted secreted Zn-dependent protease
MQSSQTHMELLRAVELAGAGQRAEAARLLRLIVQREPGLLVAWRWLAYCTSDPQEAQAAIRYILRANPDDTWAQQAWPGVAQQVQALDIPRAPVARVPRRRNTGFLPLQLTMAGLLLAVVALIAGTALRFMAASGVPGTGTFPLLEVRPTVPPPIEPSQHVVVSTDTTYYTIQAADASSIQQQLYELGPRAGNGERSIAVTTYEMSVDWQIRQTGQNCQIDEVVVNLDVVYTYPRWEPTGSPPPSLYEEWDRFMQHVVAHEETHGRIALGCANEIAALVYDIGPQSGCDGIQAALGEMVEGVYQTCEQRQQAFDDAEGRTTFPLPR